MTVGPAASFAPTNNPTPPSPCAGRCASGRYLSPRCCYCSRPRNWAPSNFVKTSSTTSASCLATRESSRPACRTSFGGRAAGCDRSSSSTGLSCSTWRRTRRRWLAVPLALTFMEYELLKFLATHPGKVFTRETLLSRVWGYEYYGGARTVDVHVRRLRAKLGEEHANLISTVRSVGYRFGQSRWAL